MKPAQPIACLVMESGAESGRRFQFVDSVVIGRGQDADLQLEVFSISRRHALVRRLSASQFVVEELGSQNGTWVNGVQVHGSARVEIGDRIQFGPRVTVRLTVLEPAEEQLAQAHQMELIGRLSAGIAHDINNLLTILKGATLGLRELPASTPLDDPEANACLRDIEAATQRATELTKRLGGLMRGDVTQNESVDLSALCHEVLQLAQRTFPCTIKLESEIMPKLFVNGGRGQLHQLLLNPCINARDAMPDGGTLTLRCELVRSSAGTQSLPPASHVVVTITDTGTGMDDATLANVFEPFFTTKARELGTGLGLATVKKIAHDHGGRVALTSSPGKGASMQIFLPVDGSVDPRAAVFQSQTMPSPAPRELARPSLVPRS